MNSKQINPEKHQRMVDRHNYRKAHPGIFARAKKFITPYYELEEYRNRSPSPIKKAAPFIPMLLMVTVIYGAIQLAHSLRVNSKEKAIAAYVAATPTKMDDGIIGNKKELGELAHAMLKLKLTPEEAGTLIGMRNRLNCTGNFIWNPIGIERLVETLRYQAKFISTRYSVNREYMDALFLKWASAPGLAPDAALRRNRVHEAVGMFNAAASDELKMKIKEHPLD